MRAAALLLCAAAFASAAGADEPGVFTDPEDGKFDTSSWLLDKKGFLPVPIVITEPAVGYGGGVALMFFRESIGERVEQARRSGHLTPPDVYGVAAAKTENGTEFGGVGGMFTFLDDRWRYRGGVARASVNLDFYGIGGDTGTGERKIGYNLDGWISSQQVLLRLAESDNFVAARWVYLDLASAFDPLLAQPVLPPRSTERRSSGAGLSFEHDSRDNIFTPSRGWQGSVDSLFFRPGIGSDTSFDSYRAHAFMYMPLGAKLVLGTRLDARAVSGDVPFYQLPYIDLRGVPAARYQDERVAVAEAELRWNVTPRWALIGFIGAGRDWGARKSFQDASTVTSWGGGFRYLVARRLGLYAGIDIARGPEDTAFYIQVGSAWR
jgi:hypothetical protein